MTWWHFWKKSDKGRRGWALFESLETLRRSAEVIAGAKDIAVGLTPREAVWSLNKTVLYRYTPTRPPEERHPIPVLFVYSLVNKPYVFDLRPGRSLIEYLVAQGLDVYLLDWGSPGPEDSAIGLDEFALDYLPRAARALRRISGAEGFTLLGYCLGSVLAALYATQAPASWVRGLALLTPPADFSVNDTSAFSRWLGDPNFDVDQFLRSVGNVPAEVVEAGAKLLKPMENYVGTYTGLLDKLDDEVSVEGWQALHRWVHEGVPFPGESFRQWVYHFVRENRLMQDKLSYRGKAITLGDITAPVLIVVAEHDHIVPPAQSRPMLDKLGSADKELYQVPAGHVGLVIGRSAKNGLWPKLAQWMKARG
jgi:polyhydroxyalkanoate synthase